MIEVSDLNWTWLVNFTFLILKRKWKTILIGYRWNMFNVWNFEKVIPPCHTDLHHNKHKLNPIYQYSTAIIYIIWIKIYLCKHNYWMIHINNTTHKCHQCYMLTDIIQNIKSTCFLSLFLFFNRDISLQTFLPHMEWLNRQIWL